MATAGDTPAVGSAKHSCDEYRNEFVLHDLPQYRVTGFRESPIRAETSQLAASSSRRTVIYATA
jgi:hypothetical protein